MSLALRSARNFSMQSMGFLVVICDRVLLTGLLIRAWGVDAFSDWAVLLTAAGLIGIGDLGFQIFLGNMLVRARARGRRRTFNVLVGFGITFYLTVSALILLAVAALVTFTDVRDLLNLHGHDLAPVLLALGLHQTLRLLRNSVGQIYRGMGDMHLTLWTDIRATSLGIAGGAAAVLLGAGPLEVALIYLGTEMLFGIGWAAVDAPRRYKDARLSLRKPSLARIRSSAAVIKWYFLFQMMSYLLSNLPVLIVGWLGLQGPLLVMFVVQRTLVNIGRTTSATLSQAVGIELAGVTEASGSERARNGIFVLGRINGALAGLLTASLLLFGPQIVGVWTGVPSLGSLPVLAWLLLPLAVIAPAVPLQMLSVFTHRLKSQATATVVQAAIAIPGAIWAGSHYGVVGVAAALAIGEIVGIGIVGAMLASRSLRFNYLPLVASTAVVTGLAFFWAMIVGATLNSLIGDGSSVELAAKLLIWAIFAGVPVGWLSLTGSLRSRAAGYALRAIRGKGR